MRMTMYIAVLSVALFAGQRVSGQADIALRETVTGRAEVVAGHSISLQTGFHAVAGSNFHAYIGTPGVAEDRVAREVTATSAQVSSPTLGKNYVRTIAYREQVKDTAAKVFAHTEQVAYFDGLGRPVQTVAVGASPGGRDVVSPVVYDGFGRQAVKYLPYEAGQSDGRYVTNAVDACIGFYSGTVAGRVADPQPYSTAVFDGSPLDRTLSETGPGQDWYTANKATGYKYFSNASPVGSWDADKAPVTYPSYTLYVAEVADEDGNVSREYKDKLGRVVRTESVDGTETLATTYVYDDLGLLRIVVPPKAESPAETELCYFYAYDSHKRMVSKKIPGAGTVYMVYDMRDRLVLTQDGNQRAENANNYLFTKYDALNRPVMTGYERFNDNLSDIRASFGESYAPLYERGDSTGKVYDRPLDKSYPSRYPVSADSVRTVTWYDDYSFIGALADSAAYAYDSTNYRIPAGFAKKNSALTTGMVTGTMAKVIGDANSGYRAADTMLVEVAYFDDYGSPVRTIADNHMGGKDVVSNRYLPVTRAVAETVTLQKVPGQTDLEVSRGFAYDHTGRLLETTAQAGNGHKVVLSSLRYNAVGDLVTKYLHSPDTLPGDKAFAQKVDYAYNVRGWLTKINDPAAMGGDAFAMELRYNTLDGIGTAAARGGARYDGNISALKWNTAGDRLRGYGFAYDGLNRLTAAKYGEGGALDANTGAYDENIPEYDANGNIVRLQRYFNGALADSLTYTYELAGRSNRLEKVADHALNDAVGDLPGVSDYAAVKTYGYGYDANGNMTKDPGKDTDISYNYLNLPRSVSFDGGGKIFYFYDATGRKLAQSVETTKGSVDRHTDYVGGTVYTNGAPSFAATEEGRMVPDGSGGWRYEYFLKDHLGNTRAVVSGALIPGGADVLQTTGYYPFGLVAEQTDYNTVLSNYRENRYLYNGKELQNDGFGDVELGWYDYGARMYDASLGRFHTVDPKASLASSWSPYRAFFCNPINNIDPDGQYELPASVVKNYPMFAAYIKNNVRNDVMGSTIVLNALAKNTAADNHNDIGNLTRAEVEKAVTWNSGPLIIVRDNPGDMEGANGFFNSSTGQIELSTGRIAELEKILSSDASDEDKMKALSAVFMTLLHETVHYGDYLDGSRQDGGEPGNAFEVDVWQGKEIEVDGESFFIQYFMGDKYNPDDMQQIIDEKAQTEEGKKTFPTLPENYN